MIKQEIAQLKKMASVTDYIDEMDKLKVLRLVKPFVDDNTALSGMTGSPPPAIIVGAQKNRAHMRRWSTLRGQLAHPAKWR